MDLVEISTKIGACVNGTENIATAKIFSFLNQNLNQETLNKLTEIANYLSSLDSETIHSEEIQNILSFLSNNMVDVNDAEIDVLFTQLKEHKEKVLSATKKPRKRTTSKKNVATIAEIIENNTKKKNSASISEELKSSNHPLIKLLDIIDNHNKNMSFKDDIEVIEDKNDGEETTFNGKNYAVGDASSVIYKKDKTENKITADSKKNNMTLSHKKGSPVYSPLVADTIFATVNYMTEKGEIPFTININGKSKEFIDSIMSILFGFSDTMTNTIQDPKQKNKHAHFLDNVKAFHIGNIELSIKEIKSFKSKEEMEKRIDELNQEAENKKNANLAQAQNKLNKKMQQTNVIANAVNNTSNQR
ncbi:MAG: hypothetical protein K6F04_01455 [bacterium]|nr:hypothetical protein [bacterium]